MKVNHPSTNRAQHRVTSLIQLKTLSLSHAANEEVMSLCLFKNSTLASNTIAKIYHRHSTAKLLLNNYNYNYNYYNYNYYNYNYYNYYNYYYNYTHTHTRLMALCPGLPG